MRNECNIIRDILPLYVEEMTSVDTNAFVQEHLSDCEGCRRELAKLREPDTFVATADAISIRDAEPLRAMKKRWNRKNMLLGILAVLLIAAVGAYLVVLRHRPFEVAVPAHSENVIVRTRIEPYENPYEDAYLNQRFIIEFEHREGKALQISLEDDLTEDENGVMIPAGYTLEIRETVFDLYGESEFQNIMSTGYVYSGETLPPGYDFTITVIYEDQTVFYSMAEEGLFTPQ